MEAGRRQDDFFEAAPGLTRIAATAAWHTTEWAVGATARAGDRVVRAVYGESPVTLLAETGTDIRDYARRLAAAVGLGDEDAPIAEASAADTDPEPAPGRRATPSELRDRGAELLRQSADVHFEQDSHPAYARILEVLAPDEARILRLLALKGPQPAVDVRSGMPLIMAGSQLVAPGLSMIGAEAGCRHLDRVPPYLNNLSRLGLVWFSRETIEDPLRYQVLEAQPDVIDAIKEGGRLGRTVRRSIVLTPFGEDFCAACLPLDTTKPETIDAAESETVSAERSQS